MDDGRVADHDLVDSRDRGLGVIDHRHGLEGDLRPGRPGFEQPF
ncbi:MAG: hypothetical protein VX293_10035 [Candidatus Latescibacterota bacterium]|nr:hypothetical protein [Candidatus Latescibacterota bacterium]